MQGIPDILQLHSFMGMLGTNLFTYPVGLELFQENHEYAQNVRTREKFLVTFAPTESYKRSAVPYWQDLLNADLRTKEADARARRTPG